jgi:hypothetical protein
MVRSPCTLEWPRTGQVPAPGLPMLPFMSSMLTIPDVLHAVFMLGQAHGPADDDFLFSISSSAALRISASGTPAGSDQIGNVFLCQVFNKGFITSGFSSQ